MPNPWENAPEKVPVSGQVNAFFRWKNGKDLPDSFTMDLFIVPELSTTFTIPEQAKVDISFRRLQQFKVAPGEKICYAFGEDKGIVEADEKGLITLQQVLLTREKKTVRLTRFKG